MKGDIVLYRKATDLLDRMIVWATKGPFVHVEIDIGDGQFLGAHTNGIGLDPAITGKDYVYVSPQASIADIDAGIAWLRTQVGKAYGWTDIISDGLQFMGVNFSITRPGYYDCSDLATRYLLIARDTRIIPKLGAKAQEPHTVSPNDLARAAGLE